MKRWYELFGGSAALSCVLTGGPSAKPPTSFMGSKRGYWRPILGAFGLAPGSRPQVTIAEPGPYGSVWRVLSTPGGAQAVAEIIRGWEGEEPRALWLRLRDEWREDPELRGAREVAGWLFVSGGSMMGDPTAPFGGNLEGWEGTEHGSGSKRPLAPRLFDALESVARWLVLASWSYRQGDVESGLNARQCGAIANTSTVGNWGTLKPETPHAIADRIHLSPWTIYDRAQDVPIPEDASDCCVYLDPPYVETTGYAHGCPREEVVRMALEWASRGAFVGISEQVPIEIPGWHAVRIDHERTGQKRTFSRQQAEWLTLSRPPVIAPGVQTGLW